MQAKRAPEPTSGKAALGKTAVLHMLSAVGAAWVLSLGFDVFLHAGLLAKLYVEASPFLLQPEDAFRRIPLGYLSFLVLILSLYWLFYRLDIRGVLSGFQHGCIVGWVVCGALMIGLYSISTARLSLLVGWWIGQALELGLAGAILGGAAAGVSLKRIWISAVLTFISCIVGTIVLQTLGMAPAMKMMQ